MTRRHQRYLQQRPARIARKRLKRRRKAKISVSLMRVSTRRFRQVLAEYAQSHQAPQPVRAGKKAWHEPITRFFRKPTV